MKRLPSILSSFINKNSKENESIDHTNFLEFVIKELTSKLQTNNFSNEKLKKNNIIKSTLLDLDGFSYKEDKDGKLKIYYETDLIGYIYGQISSINDVTAIHTTKNKIETENFLRNNNINTTKSIMFKKDAYDFAKIYVESSHKPLVVKPNLLSGGRGITIGVTQENFDDAWKFAVTSCKEQNKRIEILIQEVVEGIESRFLVINNKFESAVLRVPANVIGDGKHTISELIDIKNSERNENPYLKKLLIKKDDQTLKHLSKSNLSLYSVLDSGTVCFLRKSSNLTQGGDNIEISHLISDKMKTIAEQSVKAIPNLNSAGVDILYKSFEDQNPIVLEINTSANFKMHHYPWKGEPRSPLKTLFFSMKEKFEQSI